MDYTTISQNVRRISSEAVQLCREEGQVVEDCLMAVVVLRCELQKKWKCPHLSLRDVVELAEISSMAADAASCYLSQTIPTLTNIKMQVGMEKALREHLGIVDQEKEERDTKLNELAAEIYNAKENLGDSKYMQLHEKVRELICMKCGVYQQNSAGATEVHSALDSIMPFSTLACFLSLAVEDKRVYLENHSLIALGIWLFNEYQGVSQTPASPSLESCIQQSQHLLSSIQRQRDRISQAALRMEKYHKNFLRSQSGEGTFSVDALIFLASAMLYMEKMEDEGQQSMDYITQLRGEMQNLLLEVQEHVGDNTTVPKDAVFPLFTKLGRLQSTVADEQRMLVVKHRLLEEIEAFLDIAESEIPQLLEDCTGAVKEGTLLDYGGENAPELPEDSEAAEAVEGATRLNEEETSAAFNGSIGLNGFCPVALVRLQGAPLSHDPGNGLVEYEGKVFGFSEGAAVGMFAASPSSYLQGVEDIVKKEPLLLGVLGLLDSCPLFDIRKAIDFMIEPLQCSFGTQTPTHITETYIDKEYEWNVWAMRRHALSIADLRNKATHSCQTNLSYFKRNAEVQVWKPKAAYSQTRSDKAQTMPRKLQYISGLRGPPSLKMNVVNLELDIGQMHQF